MTWFCKKKKVPTLRTALEANAEATKLKQLKDLKIAKESLFTLIKHMEEHINAGLFEFRDDFLTASEEVMLGALGYKITRQPYHYYFEDWREVVVDPNNLPRHVKPEQVGKLIKVTISWDSK